MKYIWVRQEVSNSIFSYVLLKRNVLLKEAPLLEDILTLNIDGVNKIRQNAELRAVGKTSNNKETVIWAVTEPSRI